MVEDTSNLSNLMIEWGTGKRVSVHNSLVEKLVEGLLIIPPRDMVDVAASDGNVNVISCIIIEQGPSIFRNRVGPNEVEQWHTIDPIHSAKVHGSAPQVRWNFILSLGEFVKSCHVRFILSQHGKSGLVILQGNESSMRSEDRIGWIIDHSRVVGCSMII